MNNERDATVVTANAAGQIDEPAPVHTEPSLPANVDDAAPAPPRAAKGDDDLMSKPQHQSIPGGDELQGQPERQPGVVEYAWDDLTEDEVMKSKDHRMKRSGQLRERHTLTRYDDDMKIGKSSGGFGGQRVRKWGNDYE